MLPINRILLESDAEETDEIDETLEEMAKAIACERALIGSSEVISSLEYVVRVTADNADDFYQSSS